MQATVGTTRFDLGQLKAAVIGLGIIASAALATVGVITITDSGDASQPAANVARIASEPGSYTFQEQNILLPESGVASSQPSVDRADNLGRMREQVSAASTLQSSDEMRFLEQNVNLPVDMNVLPGDDAQELPPSSDR